jgi:hypothetical protein
MSRDGEAKVEQLALDPPIAPARVLPRQPKDELAKLGVPSSPAGWPPPAGGPLCADGFAVPAKKGLRAGEKGSAARS